MTSAVAKIIDDLRDRGGLKGTDVANIAAVSPATVSRWTAGKALPHPKTQLIISDLRYVVERLSEFYSPEETRLWLYSKHRLLDGERAIDLINRGDADKVLSVIEIRERQLAGVARADAPITIMRCRDGGPGDRAEIDPL